MSYFIYTSLIDIQNRNPIIWKLVDFYQCVAVFKEVYVLDNTFSAKLIPLFM